MADDATGTVVDVADGLRLAVGRLARRLRQQSLGGLTPSQRSVLETLNRHGDMTMSELADHERITRPSATGIVRRLADKGLLVRAPAETDGRSTVVDLTSEATTLIETSGRERTAFLAEALASLDPEDLAILDRSIEIFNRLLDTDQ
jgi:DNA-binding MarR family transcriptional regulator